MNSAVLIIDRVTDDASKPKKTLKDRIEEAVGGILEGLSELLGPDPELIPVRRPQRRPMRPARRDHRWS